MERRRRKITISVSMSPFLVEKVDKEVESDKYASPSDLISIAAAEHFIKEELELIDKSIDLFLAQLLADTKIKKQLLNLLPDNNNFKISALKKKAKACIELGEFDEALECLNKAKELETMSVKTPRANKSNKIIIENGTVEDENVEF